MSATARSASEGDALTQSIELAVAAEELGPDGALYIGDDSGGRVFKVTYDSH